MSTEYLNVAIIDDDPIDLQKMKNALLLTDSSLHCALYMFPEQAIRILSNADVSPAMIFIDMNMQAKSGFECLIELRKHDHLKDTGIYIYSSRLKHEVQDAIISAGANLVFEKPRDDRWRDIFRTILLTRASQTA